jgi:hypothetical protein
MNYKLIIILLMEKASSDKFYFKNENWKVQYYLNVRITDAYISFTKENASNIISNYIKNALTIIKIEKL